MPKELLICKRCADYHSTPSHGRKSLSRTYLAKFSTAFTQVNEANMHAQIKTSPHSIPEKLIHLEHCSWTWCIIASFHTSWLLRRSFIHLEINSKVALKESALRSDVNLLIFSSGPLIPDQVARLSLSFSKSTEWMQLHSLCPSLRLDAR